MEKAVVLDYSDKLSTAALLWKSLLLVPIWSIPLVAILGAISGLFGIAAFCLVYLGMVGLGLLCFADDVRKRKIFIGDGKIRHGHRTLDLAQLQSIGVQYQRGRLTANAAVCTFESGESMEFRLSRLSIKSVEKLLSHVEQHYPECKVDPVLRILVRCQKVARRILIDDEEGLVIEYSGYRRLVDVYNTYLDIARGWLQIGPVLAVVLSAPVWINFLGTVFSLSSQSSMDTYKYLRWLDDSLFAMHSAAGNAVTYAWRPVAEFAANPVSGIPSALILLFLLRYVVDLGVRPTRACIDRKGMTLQFVFGGWVRTVARLDWAAVTSAVLIKTDRGSESTWKIQFMHNDMRVFEFDLSGILQQDRPRVLRALERFAPHCSVSTELAETMVPKQERSYTQLWLQSLAATPERANLQALAAGCRLQDGRYRIVDRLGVGGQSTAYLAFDEYDQRNVVLKESIIPVFSEPSIKQQALSRFEHEAKMLEALDNERVVKPSGYFFEDHRCFLVLEHIKGRTMRQLVLESGPVAEKQVRAFGREMCEILKYLHSKGIIHRDFTPDNLIVTTDGALKLIDFNVAQQAESKTTGSIAGKHAYLPPEQFRGKATFQSDIYALGGSLFYLLTGSDPVPISQSSPRQVNAEVTLEMDRVVQDCTAVACEKRADDLDSISRALGESDESTKDLVEAGQKLSLGSEKEKSARSLP